ncbi:DNA-binding transcriptional regulator, MarR family [Parapedobacter luteus]|uniref:DNA-binding transcriptional regulator, MarR family n=2 Tax=Sphingobacteriaceae TaxID=84566 RepID=A0A1T5ANR4_9SPHI|nr:DNA-binding transcriptional regulator, MarR family [Parapedobacter luteus]
MALGSRLRMLAAKVTDDAAKIYGLYEVTLAPKWFPVFFVLSEADGKTITEIAKEIGHSQPSVSKIVREMAASGLIVENINSGDKRQNVISLSEKGKELIDKISFQYRDIDRAIDGIIAEATHNLWEALAEWEFLLEQQSLFSRVQEEKKRRESDEVILVDYQSKYQAAFKALNEAWISDYFEMEESDYKALDNPQEYILDNGGKILVALYQGEPVGVCALIKMNDPRYDYELAKMAVSPKVQGKGIGWLLGKAIVDKARKAGAKALYLESNTILKPAINLYHKLGFRKVTGYPSPYKRCNIQMELAINPPTAT